MVLLSPESDQPIDFIKPKTQARFIRWSETLLTEWSGQMKKNSPTTRFPWKFGGFPSQKTTIWRPRSCEVGLEFDQNDPFMALLRETNIVGLGQHGLDKTIDLAHAAWRAANHVGWSHPIIGPHSGFMGTMFNFDRVNHPCMHELHTMFFVCKATWIFQNKTCFWKVPEPKHLLILTLPETNSSHLINTVSHKKSNSQTRFLRGYLSNFLVLGCREGYFTIKHSA